MDKSNNAFPSRRPYNLHLFPFFSGPVISVIRTAPAVLNALNSEDVHKKGRIPKDAPCANHAVKKKLIPGR